MKVVIVEDFGSISDIESRLEILNTLEKEHIKASGCKEPNMCSTLSALFWYRHNLELAVFRGNNCVHKYNDKLSDKMFKKRAKTKR